MHYVDVKGILSSKNGMNIYRGCTHGCIYCDSRSLCYRMDHVFEDVAVKRDAAALLERALRSKRKKCVVSTGSMSDPYMPLERELRLTRRCAEIVRDLGFGFSMITKSTNVLDDIDILCDINRNAKCVVQMTLTTYDARICRVVEPEAPETEKRFEALRELNARGIPTVVWISPILPYINDTEENMLGVMRYLREARVSAVIYFGAGMTLREGNREYYYKKLDQSFPGLSSVYGQKYRNSYEIMSPNAGILDAIVRDECEKGGIMYGNERVFDWIAAAEFSGSYKQMSFFDSIPF